MNGYPNPYVLVGQKLNRYGIDFPSATQLPSSYILGAMSLDCPFGDETFRVYIALCKSDILHSLNDKKSRSIRKECNVRIFINHVDLYPKCGCWGEDQCVCEASGYGCEEDDYFTRSEMPYENVTGSHLPDLIKSAIHELFAEVIVANCDISLEGMANHISLFRSNTEDETLSTLPAILSEDETLVNSPSDIIL